MVKFSIKAKQTCLQDFDTLPSISLILGGELVSYGLKDLKLWVKTWAYSNAITGYRR